MICFWPVLTSHMGHVEVKAVRNSIDIFCPVILSSVCFLAGLAVWSDNEQDFFYISAARGDV
jgi:hypothetical protein